MVAFCRKLRLGNKKIQDEVLNVSGGIDFLQAAGFQLVFDDTDGYPHFQLGVVTTCVCSQAFFPALACSCCRLCCSVPGGAFPLQQLFKRCGMPLH